MSLVQSGADRSHVQWREYWCGVDAQQVVDCPPLRGRRVLVLDAGTPSGLTVVRSLGRAGATVAAAWHHKIACGRWSRYTRAFFSYPNPMTSVRACLDGINRILESFGPELVVPTTDATTLALSRHRDELALNGAVLPLPSDEAVQLAADKAGTIELAQQEGIPVPPTRLLWQEEPVKASMHVGLSVVGRHVKSSPGTPHRGGGEAGWAAPGADRRRLCKGGT